MYSHLKLMFQIVQLDLEMIDATVSHIYVKVFHKVKLLRCSNINIISEGSHLQ